MHLQKLQLLISTKITELFGIDLRTLALLRVLVSLLLLADLAVCSTDLVAHYTDTGVLPRSALYVDGLWKFSIHALSGEGYFQAILFLTSAIFATLLLVGYKTKLATLASWLFLISLQARNPLVLQAGDKVLLLILMWAIFLPWGARFSVDAALHEGYKKITQRFLSFGTVGLLLQVVFVYIFSFLLKTSPEWRIDGTAVYYALQIDQFTTSFGYFLLQFPNLLKFLTFAVVLFEIIGPILLFSPFFTESIRIKAIIGFIIMHIGFGLSMMLGLFPLVSIVSVLAFLPSLFWEKVFTYLKTKKRFNITVYFDSDCGFCTKSVKLIKTFFLLPETQFLPAQNEPSIYSEMNKHNSWVVQDWEKNYHYSFRGFISVAEASPLFFPLSPILKIPIVLLLGKRVYNEVARHRNTSCALPIIKNPKQKIMFEASFIANILASILLLYILFLNLQTLPNSKFHFPLSVSKIGSLLRVNQEWAMFAPYPSKNDGWYVILGKLSNESIVNLLNRDQEVTFDKPRSVAKMYKNYRWRKYMMNISYKRHAGYRVYYAQYVCRNWNTHHIETKKLQSLSIYFIHEFTLPDYQVPTPENLLLVQYSCPQE